MTTSSPSFPTTTRAWILPSSPTGPSSLTIQTLPLPPLGQNDILVHFRALSLNYRDISLSKGTYTRPALPNLIQGSDAAGCVLAVGPSVRLFKPGDRIMTTFWRDWISDGQDVRSFAGSDLGGNMEGAFREFGGFALHALVRVPESLDYREAAGLPCAALTAWECLYDRGDRHVRAGDTVLVQGTGGVSLFALQFAKGVGGRVVATTSSGEKEELLKKMGADVVINYREVQDWGVKVKELTGGVGADIVIDVGGASTVSQSLKAARIGTGTICLIGHLSGGHGEDVPNVWDVRQALCKVRSVAVSSRAQFEEMVRAIEGWGIKPVVDGKIWKFEEMKEAYEYLADGRHIGKVVVDVV
ncbi:NAD(P)-binding protein [Trematosphaeria pertusa]|uniref:NAD(P)-binding protein n=1 Tax=Trematosphaeria pertusa TaxID=390896 RepID=A0A6A6IPB8_9PLEO|nr:NAD(P)-binding protein [Trematosphaeria pertusa]KAF2252077.1 NAD(P)-binding protein [Trematosphaeria pertusa]